MDSPPARPSLAGVGQGTEMIRRPGIIASLLLFAAVTGTGLAQPDTDGGGSLVRLEGGGYVDEETVRTARETVGHSITLPEWTNPLGFEKDVFTFARIIFWSDPSRPTERGGFRGSFGGGGGRGGGRFGGFGRMGWVVRLPRCRPEFFPPPAAAHVHEGQSRCPGAQAHQSRSRGLSFIYREHIERLALRPAKINALRQYLSNGGCCS